MKILVATRETQGQRKRDFSWTEEGEPVRFGYEDAMNGKYGCHRRKSFLGMKSSRDTVIMKVVETDITMEDYIAMIQKTLETSGWISDENRDEFSTWAKDDAAELVRIANAFPVGMIVEKRGKKFQERRPKKNG
jgi:hypothetical protein